MKLLRIQSLLYNSEPQATAKFFHSLLACQLPPGYRVAFNLGDCSPGPFMSSDQAEEWQTAFAAKGFGFSYTFFKANLGFSKGHNRLFFAGPGSNEVTDDEEERLIILNPDAVVPFHLLRRLNEWADQKLDWGIIEARQLPLEHPKAFDLTSQETDWASGACSLYRGQAYRECGGFDEAFFMYCEDVDLSWRIKAAGYKLYYCVDTFIYHAKRMVVDGGPEASSAEQHYGTVSSLLLRAKYGRTALNKATLEWLGRTKDRPSNRIIAEYTLRLRKLQRASPAQQATAHFEPDGNFSHHRWQYRPR